MAQDYLIAQATSVPSEQAFSLAKHTINALRNQLENEKVHASLCLKT
ncbi:16236_t:CDS:1, partial [Cetraspora pellucida]